LKDITVGFVGSGGVGAVTAGVMLTEAAAYEGLYAMTVQSFGPQIRGGESSAKTRISTGPVLSPGDSLDVCVAFHLNEYPKFRQELLLKDDSIVLFDPDDPASSSMPFEVKRTMRMWPVPFGKLAKEKAKSLQAANVISLGMLAHLFGLPLQGLKNSVHGRFTRKGEEVLNRNLEALDIGRDYANEHMDAGKVQLTYRRSEESRLVLTGNDACALGALWAGCDFFAGYPITPSSEIMHFLNQHLPCIGGRFVQTEDEISAITHCVGASFAGARVMTATSGPGLSLIQEGLGLASMAELPLVVVNVQRGGPSTGLPTKSEQSDLLAAIHGTHGDAPKAVLAPRDVRESYEMTILAFYLAETYQIPVIVLTDQMIGQRLETWSKEELLSGFSKRGCRLVPNPDTVENYQRFFDTETGVSPIAIPGTPGTEYLASGIEHDEKGWPSARATVHDKMSAKRFRKLDYLEREFQLLQVEGPADAQVGAVCWGSNFGPVSEACHRLNKEGHAVRVINPLLMFPFNRRAFEEQVGSLKRVVAFETSVSGQFHQYLCACSPGMPRMESYRIAGGRYLTAEEVYTALKKGQP
jgi:2-oxoglutarate/2-oxoacid ferredoxin oxidoreductase subunit alpha